MTSNSKLKICLAASGGGHVRQILDLEPFWKPRNGYFFVTEDTALGHSIAQEHPTEFVEHVALGQAKLGHPMRMVRSAIKNCWQSFKLIRKHRPDLIVTTGAGSIFFTALWGRLFGARLVLIDSFARFDAPSAFARGAGPLAHERIAQSGASAKRWSKAHVFDPLRVLGPRKASKEPLLFATVGATLPFDRLVGLVSKAAEAGLIEGKIIVQTGQGGMRPAGLECHETLPFEDVKDILRRADIVVCHGGTGSLITALREGCRVIAVPRVYARGEHYDDHQSEITRAFESRGLVAVAGTDEEFAAALAAVKSRDPIAATTDPAALLQFLAGYAGKLEQEKMNA